MKQLIIFIPIILLSLNSNKLEAQNSKFSYFINTGVNHSGDGDHYGILYESGIKYDLSSLFQTQISYSFFNNYQETWTVKNVNYLTAAIVLKTRPLKKLHVNFGAGFNYITRKDASVTLQEYLILDSLTREQQWDITANEANISKSQDIGWIASVEFILNPNGNFNYGIKPFLQSSRDDTLYGIMAQLSYRFPLNKRQ